MRVVPDAQALVQRLRGRRARRRALQAQAPVRVRGLVVLARLRRKLLRGGAAVVKPILARAVGRARGGRGAGGVAARRAPGRPAARSPAARAVPGRSACAVRLSSLASGVSARCAAGRARSSAGSGQPHVVQDIHGAPAGPAVLDAADEVEVVGPHLRRRTCAWAPRQAAAHRQVRDRRIVRTRRRPAALTKSAACTGESGVSTTRCGGM